MVFVVSSLTRGNCRQEWLLKNGIGLLRVIELYRRDSVKCFSSQMEKFVI